MVLFSGDGTEQDGILAEGGSRLAMPRSGGLALIQTVRLFGISQSQIQI